MPRHAEGDRSRDQPTSEAIPQGAGRRNDDWLTSARSESLGRAKRSRGARWIHLMESSGLRLAACSAASRDSGSPVLWRGVWANTLPWETMVINVSGAFVIGVLAASAAGHGALAAVRPWQFAVTGFLGCYTTVSSFSLQTLALARDGEMARASGNLLLSLILCLAAVAAGFAVGSHVFV